MLLLLFVGGDFATRKNKARLALKKKEDDFTSLCLCFLAAVCVWRLEGGRLS